MSTTPLVSIVVPIFREADEIAATLHSCISQSLSMIEVICVVPAQQAVSPIIQEFVEGDSRVRIIRSPDGITVPDAQRIGVSAASAPHMLFLEPGDELERDASEICSQNATDTNADMVEFSTAFIEFKDQNQTVVRNLSKPKHLQLLAEEILRKPFPEGVPVGTHMWRYMFRTEFLRTVYSTLPDGLVSELTDDVSILFLACASAEKYVALAEPVYRHYGGGTTSPTSADVSEEYRHALSAIDSLKHIGPTVTAWARRSANPEPVLDAYELTYLASIGGALELLELFNVQVREAKEAELRAFARELDIVVAAATFVPAVLEHMAQGGERLELGSRPARNVLLTTNILTTGGVSGVLRSQAKILLTAGYQVTIVTHREGSNASLVPDGATMIQLSGASNSARLLQWAEICQEKDIDVVIDHRTLYSRDWPGYALAARACNVPTIGWIHSFALRPTYNSNELHSLLQRNLNSLAQLIVLSPLDVAFWKLRGTSHVAYLPNPPSPLLLESQGVVAPKDGPLDRPVQVIWWGRLEERTKKVTRLVDVAVALKRLGLDFRLHIIGPDGGDMNAARLSALVTKRGLEDVVDVAGPKHGEELLAAIDASDIFISTSIIEGYPLAVAEAQARGLPIAMYDLPWLALVQNSPAVITVPQGDADQLADAIFDLVAEPERYQELSRASIEAAGRAASDDFTLLYDQLLAGVLPAGFSPEPNLRDGRELLRLLIFYTENRAGSKSADPKPKPGRRKRPRARVRVRTKPQTLGSRIERRFTPAGHYMLGKAPWLRPVARQLKQVLLRH